MPQPTLWRCKTFSEFRTVIPSSDPNKNPHGYVVMFRLDPLSGGEQWTCSCPHYGYRLYKHHTDPDTGSTGARGQCKHIKTAMLVRCGWHQAIDGGHPQIAESGGHSDAHEPNLTEFVCPNCGGSTIADQS